MARILIQQPALTKYRVPVFRELASRGHDVTVLYSETPGLPNVEPVGFDAKLVPMRLISFAGRFIKWQPAGLAELRTGKYDAAIVSWDLQYPLLLPMLRAARRRGIGTVLWGHGYSKRESGWRRRLRLGITRAADACMFYNNIAAHAAVESGVDQNLVFVAINSLDQSPIREQVDHWNAHPSLRDEFLREKGIDGPLLLYVSRLSEENRVDLLLGATAELCGEFPNLHCAIIGNGDNAKALQRLATELGIADSTHFTGEIYDEADLAGWFMNASIFVYPANIGLSILHAMGYGLPVITSDRIEQQNPEIEALRDGENGLLYADDDCHDLSAKIATVLRNEDLRQQMKTAASTTARETFSIAKMVDGFEAAVEAAIARRRGSKTLGD